MGSPKLEEDLPYKIFAKTQSYLKTLPQREKVNWNILFPNANPQVI